MSWHALQTGDPDLAAAGERLLHHSGICAGFLGTVRKDGGPRLHPVFPVLRDSGLYIWIVDMGWKYRDLVRDPRYALHAFPLPEGGEEFYIDGVAHAVTEPAELAAAGGAHRQGFERCFRLEVERALWTKWEGWTTGSPWPSYRKWHARANPTGGSRPSLLADRGVVEHRYVPRRLAVVEVTPHGIPDLLR